MTQLLERVREELVRHNYAKSTLWIAAALRTWTIEAKITDGPIFRAINKAGRIAAHGFSPKVIWGVV